MAVGAWLSWRYSDEVLTPMGFDSRPSVGVEAVLPHAVVLERTEDSARPGLLGIEWMGGHAVVGPPRREDAGTVTRPLRRAAGYLAPGTDVVLDANVFAGDPRQARGLPYRAIPIRTSLGPMPAWLIPASGHTWAIFVHGIDSTRQVGLRMAPGLHRAGLPTLLISYREDPEAPQSPDGLRHMGLTEWLDLESAARYALNHGARRLVLVGYSMGGAIVTQFMERSPLADRVSALILDAPVLDWRKTLEFNASEQGWPALAALPLEWAIGARIDVDWDRLDALDHLSDLHLPILLFHGGDDQIVPVSTSEALARALPRDVTYYRVPGAGHCESWNVAPGLYERRVRRFLSEHGLLKTARKRLEPDHTGRARG